MPSLEQIYKINIKRLMALSYKGFIIYRLIEPKFLKAMLNHGFSSVYESELRNTENPGQ